MVKLLSLASTAAVVALALAPAGTAAVSSRALLAEAAPSPMAAPMAATAPMAAMAAPAAPATPTAAAPTAAANTDMTLAAEGVSFADGKLVVKDPADTLVKRNGQAIGLASTAATFAAGKVTAPAEAVILGVGADGAPLTAVASLSNPILSDDGLTFDAVILAKPASDVGAVGATAAKAGTALVPASTPAFKAKTAALIFDGTDASAAAGDKSFVGAVVGAGAGAMLCGPFCAAGGAWAGSWW